MPQQNYQQGTPAPAAQPSSGPATLDDFDDVPF